MERKRREEEAVNRAVELERKQRGIQEAVKLAAEKASGLAKEQERVNTIRTYAEESGLLDLLEEATQILQEEPTNQYIKLSESNNCNAYDYTEEKKEKPRDLYIVYRLSWNSTHRESTSGTTSQDFSISIYVNIQGTIKFYPVWRELSSAEKPPWGDTHALQGEWSRSSDLLRDQFATHMLNPKRSGSYDPYPSPYSPSASRRPPAPPSW